MREEVKACNYFKWSEEKNIYPHESEVAPLVVVKFGRLENETRAASDMEKLAFDMEDKAREREILSKKRE